MSKIRLILLLLSGFTIITTCRKVEREMMVTTGTESEITSNSAKVTGQIVDLGEGSIQHGHHFSTTANETVTGSKTELGIPSERGEFISQLANLTPETKYYVKAYIRDGTNTVYGKEISFTTNAISSPIITALVIENATPSLLEMTYNLTLANIVPAASAFTVQVNSVTRTINTVAISGTKVQLTLASAVVFGDVVTVAYTKPGSNPLQTASGGQAASITAQSVTNNVAAVLPVYVSSAVENATPSLLEMTYNMTLANIVPTASAFSVQVNSVPRTVNTVAISGTKVQLTLASAVVFGDVVTVAYTKPGSNPLQTPSGGQAASTTAQSVTNNVAAVLPVYVSSVVENATPSLLEMTYNLTLANIVPATSAFTVMVNSAARAVNSVSISGTNVMLTLASAVVFGDVVTVAYTKPGSNPLQTASGGQAASITAQSVTNNVAAVLPVYVSSAVENATPSLLEMTYNLTLANIVPAASAFSVQVNSVARTINTVAISGTKVRLTLASAVVFGDVVTVAYTKPGSNPLQTSSGGQAASITAQSVTNNVAAVLPVYVSSVIENATPSLLEMTYNLTLANIVPATSAFSVQVNSVPGTVNTVAISGTKVQLTLASAVVFGDVVTVAYTKPGSNALQTPSGGQAASITAQSVTNNVAAVLPVYVSSLVANAAPTVIEMTYNLTLANIIPAASAFSVQVNSVPKTVNTVAISGTKVQLTLASAVVFGDLVTVAYTKPGSNPLQTSSGGQAASITAQSVTNNVAAVLPVYVSSVIENATPSLLEMTYNLTLANIVPAASAFSVQVNSVARTINTVAISGTKVRLTLASAVVFGDVVTVAYTKPGSNPLQTSSGGQAASITAQSVTNNVAAVLPVYVSSVVENATPSLLEMTYNLTLANIVPAASAFTVMVNSVARTINTVAISGTNVQLTLASAVVFGDVVTVAYTKPGTNPLQTASGGQAASITAQSVTNNVAAVLPVYVSSAVENATPSLLEMTYNLTLANIVPAASAFSVQVNSVPRTVNTVAISGTKVLLTLTSAVAFGDVVTVAYTKPGSNPLQTASGGQAASITAQSVTNNVAAVLPVYVSSVVENATPSLLEMTYNLTLANIVPAASSFTILVNGEGNPVNSVSISGNKVLLTISNPVAYKDDVAVTYVKPASNRIQTPSGGEAASIINQTVTNNVTGVPSITTTPISNITITAAISGGEIFDDGGAPISNKGVCWSTISNPTVADNHTDDGTGIAGYASLLAGLTSNTTYYVRAYATNSKGTGYGNELKFKTYTGTVKDIENNSYYTVTIGTQLWFASNLKTKRLNDGTLLATSGWAVPTYCWYDNNETLYKDPYGALYNWYTLLTEKICPTGWHVPNNSEWLVLINYLGGEEVAGGKIKEAGYVHWLFPNIDASNETGFTALPGGFRTDNGGYGSIGYTGMFSSYEEGLGYTFYLYLDVNSGRAVLSTVQFNANLSVRCLKD